MTPTALPVLSEEQVAAFHRDGYLVVRGLYSPEEMDEIRLWTEEVHDLPEVPGRHMMYFEESQSEPGRRLLNRLENFVPYHQGFARLVTEERMIQAVSQLLGRPAVLFKDKINFKLPGGGGFAPHQDVQAGWDRYAGLHLTAMVAIDAADEENGRLEMVAGKHREGLLERSWEPLSEGSVARMEWVPIDCLPGDAVFFDSFAPHRSGPNLSPRPRRILYVTYNALEEGDHRERYFLDKRASYPPDCEREPGRDYRFRV